MNLLTPVSCRAPIQWQSWFVHCNDCSNLAFDSLQRTCPVLNIQFLLNSESHSSHEYLEFTISTMFPFQIRHIRGHLLPPSILTSCLNKRLVVCAHNDYQRHVLSRMVQTLNF